MPRTKTPPQVGKTVRQPAQIVNNIKAFLALHPEYAGSLGQDIGEFYLNAVLTQAKQNIPEKYWEIIWKGLPYPVGKTPLEDDNRGV